MRRTFAAGSRVRGTDALGIDRKLAAALSTLLLASTGYGLVLKLQRAFVHPSHIFPLFRLALLVPDFDFTIGCVAVCVALALLASRVRVLTWPVIIVAQLAALLIAFLQTFAHGYYMSSGQTLDSGMLTFALSRVKETAPIVASAVSVPLAIGVTLVPLWLLLGPWLAYRRTARAPAAVSGKPSWRSTLQQLAAALAVAAVFFYCTGTVGIRGFEKPFVRDSVSYLVWDALHTTVPIDAYRGTVRALYKTGATQLIPRNPDPKARKNVVVIVLESTRADATTPYTPELATTPFLQRFAQESVQVDRAYAVVPHTSKALIAIFCGFLPEVTLHLIEARSGALPGACLPSLLLAQGYETVFFQAPLGRFEERATLVRNLGFHSFRPGDQMPQFGFEEINYFGFEDAIMLTPSERWLKRASKGPFFAAYLTTATHHPYGTPTNHASQSFDDDNERKNKYLNAQHYVDGVLEKLIAQYKRAGIYDNTVFLIVGDHGEAFGEHGFNAHDDVLFEEGMRVPMLMRLPKAAHAGTHVAGPLDELSIVPTLIDALGYDLSGPKRSGYDAAPWLQRASEPTLFAACYRGQHCSSVMHGNQKLIYNFDDSPTTLYDLAHDPEEEHDLADDQPEVVKRLTHEILDFRATVHETYRQATQRSLQQYVMMHAPSVLHPVSADFGGFIELLGYRFPPVRTLGGDGRRRIPISYYFHVKKQLPRGLQLRELIRAGSATMSYDHEPVMGLHPFEDWKLGEYVEDVHRLDLPGEWTSPKAAICLQILDANNVPLPVSGSGLSDKTCVPVLELSVPDK